MPWGAAAAAVAAIGGSVISGSAGASAAKSAADEQAQAAQNATNAQLNMYGQTVGREQPFITGGQNALGQLQSLLGIGTQGGASSPILAMLGIGPGGATGGGINPATFQGSPGYQYQLQQGMNAVTNANAQTGLGGNALRQLQQTGQGLANQNWANYLGTANTSWQQLLNQLQNVAGLGQNAAGNLGNTATTVGGQIGSNAIGAGNALAAGQIGSASALSGGINNAINSISPYLLQQQYSDPAAGTGYALGSNMNIGDGSGGFY